MPIALRKGNLKVEDQRTKTSPTGRGERARLQPRHVTRPEDFNNLHELSRLRGQPREKYFDYFVFDSVNCGLPRSEDRHRALAQTIGNARGLVVVHSRKLSATLGCSTSTRSGVRKFILKTYDFVDISNATIPTTIGGSITTSPLIVVVILRHQLAGLYDHDFDPLHRLRLCLPRLCHRRLRRADHAAPDKS
jgi:hypothetical protein